MNQNVNLDLIPKFAVFGNLYFSQYDVGRTATINLLNGTEAYTIPVGATVKIQATKPSGLGFNESCTFSGNVVTVVSTETMTDEAGRIPCELRIEYNGDVLGTANFLFNVERSPHPEGTTDGTAESVVNEITLALQSALSDLDDAVDSAETAIETKGAETLASIPSDYTELSDNVSFLNDTIYTDGESVTIQTVSNASSFVLNNPTGILKVESTDAPIFTGTRNIVDLIGFAQGTFVDSTSGVTIEIDGNEVHIHGTTTSGFRFDMQNGVFYNDSFANHPCDVSILPEYSEGYAWYYTDPDGDDLPSNIYTASTGADGSTLNASQLRANYTLIRNNCKYIAIYSNGAISDIDVRFTMGLKPRGMNGSITEISRMPYGTTVIQTAGYYKLGELTWTGDNTVYEATKATVRFSDFTSDHVYAWFGDSLSQLKELPNLVADLLSTKVYDCTFAGAPLTYGDPTMYQPTGFMSLCSQIADGDFTDLSNALTAQANAGINVTEKLQHLATLQSLDFNEVTDIVVLAGTNDFDNDYVNATNFVSGFSSALNTLLTAYPHLMAYVISPTWRGDKSQGKATIPTMEDLVQLEKDVADDYCLPFYDLYHRSGINSLTASVYLQNDLLHPSDSGDALLANKCAKWLSVN